MYSSCSIRTEIPLNFVRYSFCTRWKGNPITGSKMPDGRVEEAAGRVATKEPPVRRRPFGRGDVLRPGQQDLTRRRHVDLVRVSSALCRPGR
ncbi:putative leader peptide [Streptomyces sp. NPDC050804]|uniref:putative leader peptide n=2 Tax=Streptomyces TaxID=1883 RepID=UPI00342154D4